MTPNDDDLEVYLAAGIDVPTAMVVAESEKPRKRDEPRKKSGCLFALTLALFALFCLHLLCTSLTHACSCQLSH